MMCSTRSAQSIGRSERHGLLPMVKIELDATNSIFTIGRSPCLSLRPIDCADLVEHIIDTYTLHTQVILTGRKLLVQCADARAARESLPKNMIPQRTRSIQVRRLGPEKRHHVDRRDGCKMG